MKVRLVFVPPGGGEADYGLDFDLPAPPRKGDYITVRRGEAGHTEDFIVRRTWWTLAYPETEGVTAAEGEHGTLAHMAVECEFAIGPFSSDEHKDTCHRYQSKTGDLLTFDASAY